MKFEDKRTYQNSSELSWGQERSEKLENVTSEDVADSPFLYMDRRLFAQALAKTKLYELVRNVQGSIIECGVHRGNSLMLFSHLVSTLYPCGFNRKVIGFDTFSGFTGLTERDSAGISEGDLGDVDYHHLSEWVEFQQRNNFIPHVSRTSLVKGDADTTIAQYFIDNPHTIVALLYMDFDLYKPTKTALETIIPHMPKGAVIAFDQLNQEKWHGETAALKDVLSLNDMPLRIFEFEPHISYAVL